MTVFRGMVIATLLLALTGCDTMNRMGEGISQSVSNIHLPRFAAATDTPVSAECLAVKTLPELSSITQFVGQNSGDPRAMVTDTKIENIASSCQVEGNQAVIEMSLDFIGTLGPAGVKDLNGQANYTYPYFLTVLTPGGQILSKDIFALSMSYEKGLLTIHKQDKLRQVITLAPGQQAAQYQIVLGFQLSESELAYNRSKGQ